MRKYLFLLLLFVVPFVAADLDTNQGVVYSFNDANLTGSNPDDLSGNGNDGTTDGATTGVSGKLAEAFDFDGTNDKVTVPNYGAHAVDTSYSFSGWFKLDTTSSSRQTFGWSNRAATPSATYYTFGYDQPGGKLTFNIQALGATELTVLNKTGFSDTTNFHHFVAVYNHSNDTAFLYVDGVLEDSAVVDAMPAVASNMIFYVAQLPWSSTNVNVWDGPLDQFAFWDGEALDQDDVDELYNSNSGCDYYSWGTCTAPAGTPFATVVVQDLFDNATLSGLTVHIGNQSNTTDGSGIATVYNPSNLTYVVDGGVNYFNVSGTATENASITTRVYGAFYNLTAFDVLGDAVSSFDVAAGGWSNSSVAGLAQLVLKPNATTEINFSKSGYYDVLLNVSAGSRDLGVANTTSMHDNEFTITAVDAVDNSTVSTFSLNVSNSTESYSSYWNTSSGSIDVPLMQGYDYLFFIDGDGYAFANQTLAANASTNSYEFSLFQQNSVFFFFFDEDTLLSITENVSVTGVKGNVSFVNYSTSGDLFVYDLDAGTWEFEVDAPSYEPRSYFLTVTNKSTQDLDVFLLNSSLAILTTFTLKDANTAELVINATFTLQQRVGPNWVTIGQDISDVFGIVVFNLKLGTEYRIIIEADGYDTKIGTFTQTGFDSRVISLDPSTGLDFITYLDDFTYLLAPTASSLDLEPVNFSITTSSPDGRIEWFSVTVFVNGTNTTGNITASPSGGTATVGLNLSQFPGELVQAVYRVKSVNFEEPLVLTKNWKLINYSSTGSYTFTSFMEWGADDNNGLSFAGRGILLTIFAIIVAVALGAFFGLEAGVIGASLVFIAGSFYGWMNWNITIVVVVTSIGLIVLGGRR